MAAVAKVSAYSLRDAQALVDDALRRTRGIHSQWELLERVYATGDVDTVIAESVDPNSTGRALQNLFDVPLERVNLVLPHLNILIASVGERVPQFVVDPLLAPDGYMDEVESDAASAAEDLLRFFWKRTHGTEAVRDMVKDLVVLGPAFCKVGWSFAEGDRPRDPGDVAAELSGLMAAEPDVPEEDLAKRVSLTEQVTVLDEPFIEYVRPHDIFVPEDARNLYQARWVAQRVRKPIDEVRAELDLPKSVELKVDRSERVSRWESDRDGVFAYAELFEFYDLRAKRLIVFQLGSDKPLFEGPMPFSHGMAPFVMMRNYQTNPRDFYGFGDLVNIAPLQGMLNEVFTLQVDNMRRAGTKLLVSDDVLTADTREALEDPTHGQIVPLSLNGRMINDVAMPLPMPALPADLYQASATIQDFMAQTLGLSDFQRGLSGASRMSGTAASAVEGHSSLRSADKQAEVARGIAAMGQQMLSLAGEMLTDEVAIKVAGVNGAYVRRVAPDMLDGEYLVTVDAGSVTAINPATRQQRAMEMANVLVPLAASNGYDPEPILRQVFRDFGADPDVMLVRAEPPMEMPAPEMSALAGTPQDLVGGAAVDAQLGGGVAL